MLYSAIRLVLLVVIWVVLLAFHVSGLLAFAIAVVLALLISYLAFRGPRDRAARYVQERAQRRGAGERRISASIDEDDAAEDAIVDAQRHDVPGADTDDAPGRPA
ncbi:uncharacterized protein DUF4229 [Luteimicrobium subarcticum]|uniref:Uncharacterized protein DUF4229 n=1 Tax=Luteimicrobium subarcticum TaxID=620910 RepID=A0A2M8WVT2_9MICO|nr:uncharacterized protein DUF4229 [Luteimicrobium subarcticum]